MVDTALAGLPRELSRRHAGLAAHLRRPPAARDTGASSAGVAELAEVLALGERQLRHHMQAATGLSPVQ